MLCDTNGGTLPWEVAEIVRRGASAASSPAAGATVGIHTHNDAELAVANTLAAVQAGATQIQGTINGYGERCGNANLCAIIPNLKLKLGLDCVSDAQLASLTETAHYVSELANLKPDDHMAYVGASAFAHKAGYHADAMRKNPPATSTSPRAGGQRGADPRLRALRAGGGGEQGGDPRAAPGLGDEARAVVERVKELESRGYQFEGAEASFELMVRRLDRAYVPPFELVDFLVLVETRGGRDMLAEAMVKIGIGDGTAVSGSGGDGRRRRPGERAHPAHRRRGQRSGQRPRRRPAQGAGGVLS